MTKSLKYLILLLVLIGGAFFFYQYSKKGGFGNGTSKTKNSQGFNGKVHFQLTDLPDGVVGQSGPHTVVDKDLENKAPMRSFRNKRRDILFALIYKQFVSLNENPVEMIEFSFKKVSLSASAILNKFGIKEKYETKISFQAFPASEGLAKVDGKVVTKKDLDLNNFIWASYETEIFLYKLTEIDRILKNKIVNAEAKQLKMPSSMFIEKYVNSKLPDSISDADVSAYIQKYNIEDTERNRKSASNQLLQNRRQRGFDYILEKYLMELPIQVGLSAPNYKIEGKEEWTPVLGDKKGLSLTLFSGTRNSQTVKLIREIFALKDRYKGLQLKYRPFFLASDKMQYLASQIQFCVFMKDPNAFWDFFEKSLGDYKNETEAKLLAVANDLDLNSAQLKTCLTQGESKQVVDYHLQYAMYLGITSEPVLYIDGEVLYGGIRISDVEKIIQRKLEIPAAGDW